MSDQLEPKYELQSESPIAAVPVEPMSILDLFMLLTATAVALACTSLFFRGLDVSAWSWLGCAVLLQALFVSCVLFVLIHRRNRLSESRKRMLVGAGRFLGVSDLRYSRGRRIDRRTKLELFLYFALAQCLLMAVLVSWDGSHISSRLYMVLLVCLEGITIAFAGLYVGLEWRNYPLAIEFFEGGMSRDARTLILWEHIQARPSSVEPAAVVLVHRNRRGIKDTILVRCSASARHTIFEYTGNPPAAKRD